MKKLILPCLLLSLGACTESSPGFTAAKIVGEKGYWTMETAEKGGWVTLYIGNAETTPTLAEKYLMAAAAEKCDKPDELVSVTKPNDVTKTVGLQNKRRSFRKTDRAWLSAFFCRKSPKSLVGAAGFTMEQGGLRVTESDRPTPPLKAGDLVLKVEGKPVEQQWQLELAVDEVTIPEGKGQGHASMQVRRGDREMNLQVPVVALTESQIINWNTSLRKTACEDLPKNAPAPKFCI